jgi:hypothetical protein
MTTRAKYIPRYYDIHEYAGEELSQSRLHFKAIEYLLAVDKKELDW